MEITDEEAKQLRDAKSHHEVGKFLCNNDSRVVYDYSDEDCVVDETTWEITDE